MRNWMLEKMTAREEVNVYFLKFLRQDSHLHTLLVAGFLLAVAECFLLARALLQDINDPLWPGVLISGVILGGWVAVALSFSYKLAIQRNSDANLVHLIELTPIAPQRVLRGYWLSWWYGFGTLTLVTLPGLIGMGILYPRNLWMYTGMLIYGALLAPIALLAINACTLRFEQFGIAWLLLQMWTLLIESHLRPLDELNRCALILATLLLLAWYAQELFRRSLVSACRGEEFHLRAIWLGLAGIWVWLQFFGQETETQLCSSAVLFAIATGLLSRNFDSLQGIEIHLREKLQSLRPCPRLLRLLLGGAGAWQWPICVVGVSLCTSALPSDTKIFGLFLLFTLCWGQILNLSVDHLPRLARLKRDETAFGRVYWGGVLAGVIAIPIAAIFVDSQLSTWLNPTLWLLGCSSGMLLLGQIGIMIREWREVTSSSKTGREAEAA